MAIWRDRLLPHIVDKACGRHEFVAARRRALVGVTGDVVEIGFGSGLNLAHYPEGVDRILAVEPSAVARQIAGPRIAAGAVPVEFVGLDGQAISLEDGCATAAVSTFTLCTIPDASRALGELARVLRPGGQLHFLEHGLSPDAKVAAWQHRLTPLQRCVAGGCHLDRPIARLVTAAGFKILSLENFYLTGPRSIGYMYLGVAEPG